MKPSIAVLPVVGAGVAAAIALSAGASGQSSSPTATTIKVVQTGAKLAFVDAPPHKGTKSLDPGDVIIITGKSVRNGKPFGTSALTCTVTLGGKHGNSQCLGTAKLPGGTVAFQGLSNFDTDGDTFSVTGGTGQYAGASGVVSSSEAGGDKENVTLTLQ